MNEIISVENIHKNYKNVKALQGVSLKVEKGTILGLLGPNGAGKTTLVNILTTLIEPSQGKAFIAGIDVVKNPGKVRSLIGLAGQFAAVDGNLTGRENLELVGRLYHLPWKEVKIRTNQLLEQFSLIDSRNRMAKNYSGGMRRRLDIASSLIGKPEILFLDEPTTGLDPKSRIELWQAIKDLVKQGTTVLLTTQYLEEADQLADNIVIIDKGKVVAEGTSSQLKANLSGGVVDLHLVDKNQTEKALSLLRVLNPKSEEPGYIYLPAPEGHRTLLEVIKMMDAVGLLVSDIELRKPTLDEVFLTLTAQHG